MKLNRGQAGQAPRGCSVPCPGARLLLKGPIKFEGAVTFSGRLSVQGLAPLQRPCINVGGDCTVASGAALRVENCSNAGVYGWDPTIGGGVYVDGDLHVHGHLAIHGSHAWKGGGVFVRSASAELSEAAAPEASSSGGPWRSPDVPPKMMEDVGWGVDLVEKLGSEVWDGVQVEGACLNLLFSAVLQVPSMLEEASGCLAVS